MGKISDSKFGAAAVALLLLVAACGPRPDGPAPVVSGGEVRAEAEPEWITVQPGQTLSGIAHAYHVPMRVVAEANHLAPPYRIEVGRNLMIPRAGPPAVPLASPSLASLPPPKSEQVAVPNPPGAITAERAPPPPTADPSTIAVTPTPAAPKPSLAADDPHLDARPAVPQPAPAATSEPPAAAAESGAFAWPVRGRILASYGSGRDGTHNDGINISAPRGAAVEAAGGGVVAYAGNELRGYGNLILIKHPSGWISAYAHCDLILVKRGEKVVRGQTIARVGSTGSVTEPQLHFELRRGNHSVDPREFLAPLPTAGTDRGSPPS
jgi:murein DD-endopeptidase MepM/ murein hydrolase activator NlpD